MPSDWPARFTAEALAKVDAFLVEHSGYTRDGVEQPGQGATNRVIFAHRDHEVVVFKVFCEAERKERECFGLRHWAKTGLVPQLLWDVDSRMIVMSYVAGTYLRESRAADGEGFWHGGCREVGRAIGSLTRVPLSAEDRTAFESRFYQDSPTLAAYLGRILELARSIHERDRDFRDGFWRGSLGLMEAALPGILAEPAVLYHQDVANLHVRRGRFMGFFDLEMCRVGCATMQLASSLAMLARERVPGETFQDGWGAFREGWEVATGKPLGAADLRAALAVAHFLAWREISRYMSYDGTPGTGFAWCGPADPVQYRRSLEAAAEMLGVERG
jgi:hypothetical protein